MSLAANLPFRYPSPPHGLFRFVTSVLDRMEYEVQHCARCCSTSGREFAPGEEYYSALVVEDDELKRYDYAVDAWPGPPETAVGWWKSRLPQRNANKKHWAPNDVMLDFWDRLADQSDKQDMRYVLTLLLVRRRVLRVEEEKLDPNGLEVLVVHCPRRDAMYEVPAVVPSPPQIDRIQEELASLLR